MNHLNQAALILHEAFYHELRNFGEITSIRTRRSVGLTLAGIKFKPFESLVPKPRIWCIGNTTDEFGHTKCTRLYFTDGNTMSSAPVSISPVFNKINNIPIIANKPQS